MIISALLITYNHERFVVDCLKSIFRQTRKPDELIIADDGSRDATVAVIEEYFKTVNLHDCNIVKLYSPENKGIMGNVQWAADHSSGDMLAFFAGDDIYHEKKLEIGEQCFERHPEASCVVGSYDIIDEDSRIIGEVIYPDQFYRDYMETVRRGRVPFSPFGCVYHRRIWDAYGPVPLDLPNEDDQLMFRALISGGIAVSSQKTALYRLSAGSASSWLRENRDMIQFARHFAADQRTRCKHMSYWKKLVRQSPQMQGAQHLLSALDKKEAFYAWLQEIESQGLRDRIHAFCRFHSVLCLREMFICLCGFRGIMGWQAMRHRMRRI